METFMKFSNDFDNQMKKSKQIKEFKIFERHEDGIPKIMYSRAKIPFMSDRENLIEFSQKKLSDVESIFVTKTVERDDCPVAKGAIRMDIFKATKALEENGDLYITEFSNFNLKGMVPARLLNMIMSSTASKQVGEFYKSLKELQNAKQ